MAKEYIERSEVKEELLSWARCIKHPEHLLTEDAMFVLDNINAANVMEVPQEYAYYTDFDDENYLVHISVPISEKQFKAVGAGADLWEVLRGGEDG